MNAMTPLRAGLLGMTAALMALPGSGGAQEMDHSAMPMPMPEQKARKPVAVETSPEPTSPSTEAEHAAMGHDMGAMPPAASQEQASMDQAMDHHGMPMAPTAPRTPIPPLTDADRAAAVPPSMMHAMSDNAIGNFARFDRFEWRDTGDGRAIAWEAQGWLGTDLDRLRWRSQGEREHGHSEHADLELLYSRSVSPWWDLVGGLRHDFAPGPAQDFAAVGVVGLAPYKFEVAATLYIGSAGRSAARVETEYELPLSQRWVLQPRLEANVYGQADSLRGIGAGLNDIEAGLRLRYEVRREFAPYVGIERARRFGQAARFTRAQGDGVDDWRWVAGARFWW